MTAHLEDTKHQITVEINVEAAVFVRSQVVVDVTFSPNIIINRAIYVDFVTVTITGVQL